MTSQDSDVVIESRTQLFAALAEAAEIEHDLMCLYLYAMFGIKRSVSEDLTAQELAAVNRWRAVILGISLEEMSHLALVSNLFSALGGSPHFLRPNFPVSPGAYPAGIVVELAPFNLQTLEHFIYLERPESFAMKAAADFRPSIAFVRRAPHGRLNSTSGEYQTVGSLYKAIRQALSHLSQQLGEKQLFCGNVHRQITPTDSPLRGLIAIEDLPSALKAIDTIITQGEGATSISDSHFERFTEIKTEYLELLKNNASFEPGRSVARNPVMRKPVQPEGRVWIDHPVAAPYMDLANALYVFMLKVLVQVYLVEDRDPFEKRELLEISFSLMHMMAVIGEALTLLPSSLQTPKTMAGMSFAMDRMFSPLAKENELEIMHERLQIYSDTLERLQASLSVEEMAKPVAEPCKNGLERMSGEIEKLRLRVEKLQLARKARSDQPADRSPQQPPLTDSAARQSNAPEASAEVESAESPQIKIQFVAKKCIHSRHCVTELPKVFKANTPGAWLFPENESAEILAAVIRECPSGALTYESKVPSLKNEAAPQVNVMRIYEDGPYAFLSDLKIDGKDAGLGERVCS